ncbi:SpoVR family protein [Spongiibacter sp.]|uniref:SpoVR family protein n=1 Tax=Spongiibacter sp. TaxID=2024860 RepID=UPI00356675DC
MVDKRDRVLSRGGDWDFDLLRSYDREIGQIAEEFGLDTYPNQIEVIASEQMLDAYASVGLPISYTHWSYGKEFIRNEEAYRRGMRGLAYELVINSDPCIAYLMEDNSMPMQALVIAHACYGHNSFFKGNYLFKQWTSADAIVDYMVFARKYIFECEQKYGIDRVEETLDACHALMDHGVDRFHRPSPLSAQDELQRQHERAEHARKQFDDIWRTLPRKSKKAKQEKGEERATFPPEPQENLLYFVEKYSPTLETWQREIVRIVRKLAQYFYPQGMTKVMNEGWATFWHYTLLNTLYDRGLVDEGFMFEILQSHTNVVMQPGYDHPAYSGINPYALGFAMFRDLRRICEEPDDEDRQWFPDIVDKDWREVLDFAMRNYKDESFIAQYLSPRLIREFHLFAIADKHSDDFVKVEAIHNEDGYQDVRRLVSRQYNRDVLVPDIQVQRYEHMGDRSLLLRYTRLRERPLTSDAKEVLKHLSRLWGFRVSMEVFDEKEGVVDRIDVDPVRS